MASNKVKILIVDDEQVVCDLLHDELSERGYLCTSVLNSNEALSKLRTHYFDVALVDIRLPGISGIELLRKMCSKHHNTAVIMITAINNIDTVVEAMRLGALDYIVKPFDIDRVSSSISTVLENRKYLLAKKDSQITEESFNLMNAIAQGIEAKLGLLDGHSKIVTQRTIVTARELGITDAEIRKWVAARNRFDCMKEGQRERNTLTQNIIGITEVYLYTRKSSEAQN